MKIIYLIICFLILFLIYVCAENCLILVRRYRCGEGENTLKILQISDIHKRRRERKISYRAKLLKPDIILMTGDLVSRNEKDFSHLDYLLRELSAICPVYASPGNHELDLPEKYREEYGRIMEKYGIHYLSDETAVIEKNGRKIRIAGAALKLSVYKNADGGYSGLEKYTSEKLTDALGKKDGFTILLAHNPLCFEAYVGWGADVVFSGHVHGGAVRLPFIGGLLSPERRFFPSYSKGIFRSGGTTMIVSGGIGKPRIFNPSEIIFCELKFR